METDVTIAIPYGSYHEAVVHRAIASAESQTWPCKVLTYADSAGQGAGYARNRLLAQVETPFVVFLDADDWIEPEFVERCAQEFERRGCTRYIYTDWLEETTAKQAPDCPWTGGTWHCITTLLPVEWARSVGGFDETLPGAEDSAFYLSLCYDGMCGGRLAEPLFHYGKEGQRGRAFIRRADHHAIKDRISAKFEGKAMACCGGDGDGATPMNEKQPDDVLAQALWLGNRTERGRVSGRMYPRTGNGKTVWIDARDAEAAPHLWRIVERAPIAPPRIPAANGVQSLAEALAAMARPAPEVPHGARTDDAQPTARHAPDYTRVLRAGYESGLLSQGSVL